MNDKIKTLTPAVYIQTCTIDIIKHMTCIIIHLKCKATKNCFKNENRNWEQMHINYVENNVRRIVFQEKKFEKNGEQIIIIIVFFMYARVGKFFFNYIIGIK